MWSSQGPPRGTLLLVKKFETPPNLNQQTLGVESDLEKVGLESFPWLVLNHYVQNY
jgi:hypothetical protein